MAGGLDREPRDRRFTCTRRNFSSFRSGTSYQRGIEEAQYFYSIPERLKSDNTTTTTAPRPPSTQHVRQVRTQVTGDQPKNWSEKTKILDSACGVHVGARMTSTSAQKTRGQDSGDPKTLAKTAANHRKCDLEYQDQLSNAGGVHHRVR